MATASTVTSSQSAVGSNPTVHATISQLQGILASVPAGEIADNDPVSQVIISALILAWEHLKGSSDEKTHAYKLNRAEKMQWEPPMLKFIIERHGRIAYGSSRADLHHWVVDIEKASAYIEDVGWRNVSPPTPRFTAKEAEKLVEEIADKILAGEQTDELLWKNGDNLVVIRLIDIPVLNAATQQTNQRRRATFRVALENYMASVGWISQSDNFMKFQRPS